MLLKRVQISAASIFFTNVNFVKYFFFPKPISCVRRIADNFCEKIRQMYLMLNEYENPGLGQKAVKNHIVMLS